MQHRSRQSSQYCLGLSACDEAKLDWLVVENVGVALQILTKVNAMSEERQEQTYVQQSNLRKYT